VQLPEKEEHYAVRLLNQNPNGLLVQRSGRSHLTVIRTHIFLNHLLSSVEWMIDDKQISVNRFFYLRSIHNCVIAWSVTGFPRFIGKSTVRLPLDSNLMALRFAVLKPVEVTVMSYVPSARHA